jgi:hypothetical protein
MQQRDRLGSRAAGRLLLVPSGRLPADAETLALIQERERTPRDFTPTPLDEAMGCLAAPSWA